MSESSVQAAKDALLALLNRGAPSYKEKLNGKPTPTDVLADSSFDEEMDLASPSNGPTLKAIRTLANEQTDGGAVFQSVTVAALQILDRAVCYERRAAEAALSLGQREKLESMSKATRDAYTMLHRTLNAQGAKVMDLCGEQRRADAPKNDDPAWWFALTDAVEVLEEGTERMASLTSAQPEGSPAHTLSALIARLLRAHHDELLREAEQWID